MIPMMIHPVNNLVKALKRDVRPAGGVNMEIKAQSGDVVDVFLYDVIGWPCIDAQDIVRGIPKNARRINVRINSPGGDVFDGLAIYNFLKNHNATKYIYIDGLAASAASFISLAGTNGNIRMAKTAFFMIHNAWGLTMGDYRAHESVIDLLRKIDGDLANIYARKTGKKEDEIREMMNSETWMTGDEAMEMGFVDKLYNDEEPASPKAIKMDFNIEAFQHTPEAVREMVAQNRTPIRSFKDMTPREAETYIRDVCGVSQQEAKALVSGGIKYLNPSDGRDGSDEWLNEVKAMIANRSILSRSRPNGPCSRNQRTPGCSDGDPQQVY